MRILVPSALFCALLLPASAISQRKTNKPAEKSTDGEQMRLRMRLLDNPHDEAAHKQLHKILRDKYAFRAQMEDDGTWLKNNPEDYSDEIDMNSLATVVLSDPEYAIAVDRYILQHADRSNYPEGYDGVIDHLSSMLAQREKYTEALALEQRAVHFAPDNSAAWENLGDAQDRAGDPRGATVSFRKSLDLDTNQEGPHKGMAEAYLKLNDFKAAQTELLAAIAVYNAQYHGAAPTDSFHETMKKIQEVTKMEPQLVELHSLLARAYLTDGQFDQALEQANIATAPDDPYGDYYLKAAIYDAWGKPKEADAVRTQAHIGIEAELKKEKNASMFDDMTYPEVVFISTSPGDGNQQAAREIIRLLKPLQSGGQLKSMDALMLGLSYCDLGQYEVCKEQTETALNTNAKMNNATTNHNLGLAMLKGHDTATALVHFRKAYEMDPANLTYRMDYEQARQDAP